MAGLIEQQQLDVPTTIEEGQAQVDSLEQARQQLRGSQKESIKELFDYDKSLNERYSSPDSKMFLENPLERRKAVAGYSQIATGEINNLFDIMESVRRAEEQLKSVLDDMKKKSSSGGSSQLQLGDFLNFVTSEDEQVPDPPQKLLDFVTKDPTKKIYYARGDDGAWHFEVAADGQPTYPDAKEWTQQVRVDKEKIMQDAFGVDKATLAQLSAISVMNPKLANSLFTSIISNSVKTSAKQETSYSTDDRIDQIKEYSDRASALSDLNRNRSAWIASGVDVVRLERAINTYFTEKEQKDAANKPFDFEALRKTRGQ